ncbi:MAG TPA: type II toxin-antitoxin system RelE/ParE family toxin [Actinomycetota bacterium]|nr:type II toxin-antitoxin system RelE/ParE family toxin [Actinomycetota bacterium]
MSRRSATASRSRSTFLAIFGHRAGHPLSRELRGRYSARLGDYRIVYRIDEDERVVQILLIDRRDDVFRRR